MRITKRAPAKINLALHVTGQRADGYHRIDSIIGFASIGDDLHFEPSPHFDFQIKGPFHKGLEADESNLIVRAARIFHQEPKVKITLEKNLPLSSGMGGGSADAAATLCGMSELLEKPLPDLSAQLMLGADVPICVYGKACRAQKLGEAITPLSLAPLWAVLVNPLIEVPTKSVFEGLEVKDNAPLKDLPRKIELSTLQNFRNDLSEPAEVLFPVLSEVKLALRERGSALTRMSGSGGTVFGIFASGSAARDAKSELAQDFPQWWCQMCQIA